MKQHKFLKITISLILLVALITAASIFLSYNVLKVRTFSYETDKAVDPVRAVVISDLHEHEFGKDNVKLVEKIREQEPDIILMVGDFVNQDSTESTVVVKLVEQLSKLAPVCYSLGNHEESYMAKTDWNFPKEIEKAGAHFLDKEYVDVDIRGTKLRIGGDVFLCIWSGWKGFGGCGTGGCEEISDGFTGYGPFEDHDGAQTGFLYIWRCGVGVGCGSGCERT